MITTEMLEAAGKRNLQRDILATNMNRRAMAREIGISPTTVCKIANGAMPDMLTLKKVAAWLGYAVEDYVGIPTPPKLTILRTQPPLWEHIIFAHEKWRRSQIRSVGHE